MKAIKFHGNYAFWHKLNLTALDLRALVEVMTSPIPANAKIKVCFVDNLKRTNDERKEELVGEISKRDKDVIIDRMRNGEADYLITLNGNVVGYAYLTGVQEKVEPIAPVKVEDILDTDTLAIVIKPKANFVVSQTITINLCEEVVADTKEEATQKASDLLDDIEDMLYNRYGDRFSTSDYYTDIQRI